MSFMGLPDGRFFDQEQTPGFWDFGDLNFLSESLESQDPGVYFVPQIQNILQSSERFELPEMPALVSRAPRKQPRHRDVAEVGVTHRRRQLGCGEPLYQG